MVFFLKFSPEDMVFTYAHLRTCTLNLEKERERETERERDLERERVPLLRIVPSTFSFSFWSIGQWSNQLSHLVRVNMVLALLHPNFSVVSNFTLTS